MKNNTLNNASVIRYLFVFSLIISGLEIFSQTTYFGNGNTGFGGAVGESTLEFDDNGTTITGTFTKGSGNFDDAMVIYISTGAPGRGVIDGNVDDEGGALRRAISSAGVNESDITFPLGFEANFGIGINSGFGGLWGIPSSGVIGDNDLNFITSVGAPGSATNSSFTFSFEWADIGLSGSDNFSFVITYLNQSDGNTSNEGYGAGLPSSNPGSANITFTDSKRYPFFYVYDGTSWTPSSPIGVSQSSRDAIIESGSVNLTSNTTLRDFIVSPSAELTVDPSSTLDLDGSLTNNGTITFESDAIGSAQLDELNGNLSGSGDFVVERFIPANGNRAFRFLASPVNSNLSIRDNWQEGASSNTDNPNPGFGTHISGTTVDGTNGFDATQTGNPSLLMFNNKTQSWGSISDTDNNTLEVGKAYNLFVRGDRSIDLTSIANPLPTTNTTLRATGDLVAGNIDVSTQLADNSGEFSLIGNPYQSIINVNDLSTTNIVSGFYWAWDPNINADGAYVTVELPAGTNASGSAANQFVMPGQAFFVRNSAANSTLQFTEAVKDVTATATAVFSDDTQPKIDIRLFDDQGFTSGDLSIDAIGIRFNANGNNAVDFDDAPKLANPGDNLARQNNNDFLSIENRALPLDNEELVLAIWNHQYANYNLQFDVLNFDSEMDVVLVDNYLNTETLLQDGLNDISFSVDANIPESLDLNRFSLKFDNTTLGVDDNDFADNFSLYPNPSNNGIFNIRLNNRTGDSDTKIVIHNLMGQQVYEQTFKTLPSQDLRINANTLSAGVYMVEIKQNKHSFTSKLILQ